jgi:multidrug transporter EmrE-like cation transporter
MGIPKRILHILIGIGLILIALLLVLLGEDGPDVIALILGISMLIYGIRCLVAFASKFRFMVGGRSQLYIGIIALDLGLLIISSFSGSTFLILLYLLGIRLVTGGIDLARAIESKKNGAPWKMKLFSGIVSLATVILGLVFFRDPETVVDIYCIGLLISAVEHFISAFRRSKVVTIA